MLASLRRAYYYVVLAGALLFTVGALQNFLTVVLRQAGVRDYAAAPTAAEFSQALTFILADLIVALPVGGLHWFLARRDLRAEPAARGGPVLALFITLLLAITGLTTIFTAASLANALLFNTSQTQPIASLLALTLAWGAALALLLWLRFANPPREEDAITLSAIFLSIAQWVLLIASVILGAIAIQSGLQDLINPLPACGLIYTAPCGVANTAGDIAQTLVVALGLAGFAFLTSRSQAKLPAQINDLVGIVVGTITLLVAVVAGAQFFLYLANGAADVNWPQSLIITPRNPPSTDPATALYYRSFTFIGPLVTGAAALAVYLTRLLLRTRAATDEAKIQRQVAFILQALPLAFVFTFGGGWLLGSVFVAHPVGLADWVIPWSLLIGGVAWLGLWPALARMSDPRGAGPSAPRRVYELLVLAAAVIATVIALAFWVYHLLSGALGVTSDPTGDNAARALGAALAAGAVAGYYAFVTIRDGRRLRQRAPAPDAAPTPAAMTLERVLEDVASARVSPTVAAAFLRQHPNVR